MTTDSGDKPTGLRPTLGLTGLASNAIALIARGALIAKKQAHKWARPSKLTVGWASHLFQSVYPGVMIGAAALIAGYTIAPIAPNTFSYTVPSLLFMIVFCLPHRGLVHRLSRHRPHDWREHGHQSAFISAPPTAQTA